MNKKIISVFLVCGMLILHSFSVLAATPTTDFSGHMEDIIIQQALALDQSSNIEGKDFTAVVLSQGDLSIGPLSGDVVVTEQAIQAVSIEGDLIEVTTIFPYKITSDGELVNSFEYTPTQITRDSTDPTTFVDITVTIVTYYGQYFNLDIATSFYRHGGIEAYWNSSNSTAGVSNLCVAYESAGHMYQYPECTTASYKTISSFLIQRDYFISSSIDQNNPVKGQSYFDGDHTMSRSTVLDCANALEHGGMVSVTLTYSVNGKSYVHDRTYNVYGGVSS